MILRTASSIETTDGPDEHLFTRCAACRARTRHLVLAAIVEDGFDEHVNPIKLFFQTIRCEGCEHVQFRLARSVVERNQSGEYRTGEIASLYPDPLTKRDPIFESELLPVDVQRVYFETLDAVTLNCLPVLTGIGVRAIIEAVCREKGATEKNLEKKIDGLVGKGVLLQVQADLLHKTRVLGNNAAHEAKPLKPAAARAALEVVEHLLHTVYILPRKSVDLDSDSD